MPLALYALTAGAFGAGVTELVLMGLLIEVSANLRASIASDGLAHFRLWTPEASDWRQDVHAMARRPVLLGLLTTALGYAGVFSVFTYIAPMLTTITGFPEVAASPILLAFGGGLGAVPIFAAMFPLAGVFVAMASPRRDQRGLRQPTQRCPAHEGEA